MRLLVTESSLINLRLKHNLEIENPLPACLIASLRVLVANEEELNKTLLDSSCFASMISTRNEMQAVKLLKTCLCSTHLKTRIMDVRLKTMFSSMRRSAQKIIPSALDTLDAESVY